MINYKNILTTFIPLNHEDLRKLSEVLSAAWHARCEVLTPVVDGCDGMDDTVVCCVATEEDLCCGINTVFMCW